MLRYWNQTERDRESTGKLWQKSDLVPGRLFSVAFVGLFLSACETGVMPSLTTVTGREEAGGIIAADEPQATIVAREILNAGGSAADGAAALGFALTVTLQSASGLGGGGLCTVFDAAQQRTEVLNFLPVPAISRRLSARWQVAVPTLARGLFALHAKYGKLPWQKVVVPAENLARFGHSISRAFARDVRQSSAPLANDPKALDTFMSSRRTMLEAGDRLTQLDLAATLGRIRARKPGDFYAGALARTMDESALTSGASLAADDLRVYSPSWHAPQTVRTGSSTLYIGTGGISASMLSDAFSASIIKDKSFPYSSPHATGFIVADSGGNAVACTLTMTEPFGLGLVLDGLGFLLSPAPGDGSGASTQLATLISVDDSGEAVNFLAAAGGAEAIGVLAHLSRLTLTGQSFLKNNFPSALPVATNNKELTRRAQANAAYCPNGLAEHLKDCLVSSDPAGMGYGLVAVGER